MSDNTTKSEKSSDIEEINKVLSYIIDILETFDIYTELDIVSGYQLEIVQGIRLDDDINDYIDKSVINELKKQYIDTEIIELPNKLIEKIKDFNNILSKINKSHIISINPEMLFTVKGNEKKPFIKVFRERLRILADFFTELIDFGYYNNVLTDTLDTVLDKFNLIDDVNTDSIRFIFSANLRNILDKKGISQRGLAKKLSVRQQTVNHWCNAVSLPSISSILEIANALEINTDYLIKPHSTEIDLSDNAFSIATGLSIETIKNMKKEYETSYNYKNYIVNLLDFLILNYSEIGYDLLSEIANYLKPSYDKELYLISDYELYSLADDILEDCKDIKDVKSKIEDYITSVETNYGRKNIYDVSNIQLQNILKVLVRIKDEYDK